MLNAICVMLLLCRCASLAVYYFEPYTEAAFIKAVSFIFGRSANSVSAAVFNVKDTQMWLYFEDMLHRFIFIFLPMLFFSKFYLKRNFEETFVVEGKMIHPSITVYALLTLAAYTMANAVLVVGSFLAPEAIFAAGEVYESAMSGYDMVVYFVSACVFVPFIEEYIYRGVIFGSLRKFGFAFAALASALIFSFSHTGFPTMAYAFVNGFFYAFIFERTGNIKTAVFLHALNNTVNFVINDVLPAFLGDGTLNVIYNAELVVLMVLALPGIYFLFFKKYKKKEQTDEVFSEQGEEIAEKKVKNAGVPELAAFFMVVYAALGIARTVMGI